jgi:hypothetical protein
MMVFKVGARYRLKQDVERFPFFIARAGMTGSVIYDDGNEVLLRMDELLDGAEEWDNYIQWIRADGADPAEDLEPLN